jgi:hypothetical protein
MVFAKQKLVEYKSSDLDYVQRFAGYAYSIGRIEKGDLDIITANVPYVSEKANPPFEQGGNPILSY